MEGNSMGKNQHVVPHSGQWAVRGAGNSRVTRVCSTQREAQEKEARRSYGGAHGRRSS